LTQENGEGCFLLFMKYPEPGKVKTRLSSEVSQDFVVKLYRRFILDILSSLENLEERLVICFSPPEREEELMAWLGLNRNYLAQEGEDMGQRMCGCFRELFSQGFERAVLIGADSPDLPPAILREAMAALEDNDAVLGPSTDGGYYLIGFTREGFHPAIFEGLSWGTNRVLAETRALLEAEGRKVHHLQEWRDVDTREDLLEFFNRNRDSLFCFSRTMKYLEMAQGHLHNI
jgi:uncharacterized protein